jgi:hypothetical protein
MRQTVGDRLQKVKDFVKLDSMYPKWSKSTAKPEPIMTMWEWHFSKSRCLCEISKCPVLA